MSLGAFGDEGNAASEPHCSDCGDPFHFDDCGGYNPPCNCGKCDGTLCRACCRADATEDEDADWCDDDAPSGTAHERPEQSPEVQTGLDAIEATGAHINTRGCEPMSMESVEALGEIVKAARATLRPSGEEKHDAT